MKEALSSSETSVQGKATWCYITEDAIYQGCSGNMKDKQILNSEGRK
jgi:hypothetical protein